MQNRLFWIVRQSSPDVVCTQLNHSLNERNSTRLGATRQAVSKVRVHALLALSELTLSLARLFSACCLNCALFSKIRDHDLRAYCLYALAAGTTLCELTSFVLFIVLVV